MNHEKVDLVNLFVFSHKAKDIHILRPPPRSNPLRPAFKNFAIYWPLTQKKVWLKQPELRLFQTKKNVTESRTSNSD